MDELFKALASLGICQTGQRYWSMSDKNLETIIKAWKKWPEFMEEHGEVAIHTLRKYLEKYNVKERLELNNIYLDSTLDNKLVESDTNVTVAGSSNGSIVVKDFSVVKFYVYNNSDITIVCGKNTIVGVEAYHNSKVKIVIQDGAKFFGEQYSNANIVSDSAIKVDKKEYIRGEIFNGLEDE